MKITPIREDYYEMKKDELKEAFNSFCESDDMYDLSKFMDLTLLMFRTTSMSLKDVQKFLNKDNKPHWNRILIDHLHVEIQLEKAFGKGSKRRKKVV